MAVTLETTLDGIVQAHVGEPDDEQFLNLVVSSLIRQEDPVRMLLPLVRGYLLGRRRAMVRALEHSAWREENDEADEQRGPIIRVRGENGTEATARTNPSMRLRLLPLLDELIYVPGHGRVRWGQATIEQLRTRAEMYEEQRIQLDRGITDLKEAIREIEDHPGATCLDDVYRPKPDA